MWGLRAAAALSLLLLPRLAAASALDELSALQSGAPSPSFALLGHESGADAGRAAAAPPAAPRLPDCASPLMRAVFDAVLPVARKGTVALDLLATADNAADPRVLIEGPAIFAGAAALIADARVEADYQTYVWEDDSEAAAAILQGIKTLELRRRAEAPAGAPPVVVRLLVDASALGWDSKPVGEVVPGIQARLERLELDPAYVRVEAAAYSHAFLGNLHSKTLVVDGRRALVMGANAEKKHDAAGPWFDAGYRFEGEVARALRSDFADAWGHGTRWLCGTRVARGTDPPRECLRRNRPLAALPPEAAPAGPGACRPMLVVSRKTEHNPLANRTDNPADQAFLGLFGAAADVIRVQTPGLNDDAARAALLDAMIRRGVEADLVLSKGFDDKGLNAIGQGGDNQKNAARLYRALRAAGVADPCARLKIRWFSRDGVAPVVGNGPGASHAKYASADGAVVVVGSSNMDTQSWNFSREIDVVVDDAATTAAWDAQVFRADFDRAIPADECR